MAAAGAVDRMGGGRLGEHLLTADAKHLLACMGRALRVYSASTGEYLFSLEHDGAVAAAALHPVYVACEDEKLVLWDLSSGAALRTMPIPPGVRSMAAGRDGAFLSCAWRGDQAGRVLAYDLLKGKASEARTKVSAPRPLAMSADGRWAATVDRHTALLWRTDRPSRPALALAHTKPLSCVALSSDGSKLAAGDATGRILVWHDVAATAMAAAAAAQQAKAASGGAVDDGGASDGEAIGAEAELRLPPATTVHWHAQEVSCLTFSEDDAYLLSGGQEAVLVMWDVASGARTYLPRLGGPLLGLAPCRSDPARYAADNTLRVVNMATLRVDCSVHGLRPPPVPPPQPAGVAVPATPALAAAAAGPLAMQPRSGLLAVASTQSVLQFYDVLRDVHVDKLQLSVRNVGLAGTDTSSGGAGGVRDTPAATHLAFSRDGATMVTVEAASLRASPLACSGASGEVLKFWERRPGAGYGSPYALAASAEEPHRSAAGSGAVGGLAYHPFDDLVVSTSGAEFRLWRREAVRPALGSAAAWSCAAVAGYRGEPLSAPAFSPDGSLLALAVGGGAVAFWDVSQLSLVGLLPLPPPSPGGAQGLAALAFLPHSQALVAASPDRLLLLDVLTLGVRWAATLPVSALAVDPRSDHWAACVAAPGAAVGGGKAGGDETHAVVLFEGCGRRPKRVWTLHAAAGWAPPLQLLFVPPPADGSSGGLGSSKCSPLLVLSPSREYILLGLDAVTTPPAAAAATGGTEQAAAAAAAEASLGFAARHGLDVPMLQMPAPGATSASGIAAATAAAGQGGARPFFFSDTPSHMLPPLQQLAPEFLLQALRKVGEASRDN